MILVLEQDEMLNVNECCSLKLYDYPPIAHWQRATFVGQEGFLQDPLQA